MSIQRTSSNLRQKDVELPGQSAVYKPLPSNSNSRNRTISQDLASPNGQAANANRMVSPPSRNRTSSQDNSPPPVPANKPKPKPTLGRENTMMANSPPALQSKPTMTKEMAVMANNANTAANSINANSQQSVNSKVNSLSRQYSSIPGGNTVSKPANEGHVVSVSGGSNNTKSQVTSAPTATTNTASNAVSTTPASPVVAGERGVFVGKNTLQYALWGHYLAYGTAILSILLGIFEITYYFASPWQCQVNGVMINNKYILDNAGTCPTYHIVNGVPEQICCDQSNTYIEVRGKYWRVYIISVVICMLTYIYLLYICIYR